MNKILFILLFFATLSIANSNIDDDKRIKDTLLKYNYGIIKMTKSGDTQLLRDMLSEDVFFKLMVWADSWKFSNLAMVAQINDLRFSPIAYNEDNATIRTMENWTFGYADLVKRNYALEPMNIFYQMHYTLEKHNGTWIIVDIKNLKEESFPNQNIHQPSLEPKKDKPKSDMADENVQGKIATH
ncbi:MAG: hypothetical protein PHU40_09835 [Sulfurimonas sp.]|jgi:hypothetical protein|nr:hypothetical protein [Sulfurimonas sp.]